MNEYDYDGLTEDEQYEAAQRLYAELWNEIYRVQLPRVEPETAANDPQSEEPPW